MNVYGTRTILDQKQDKDNKVLCRCVCGVEKRINFYLVKRGNTSSCGCLKKSKMKEEAGKRFTGKTPAHFIDYTGKVIGEITVLRRIEDKRAYTPTYLLRCNCGTEFESEISNLRRSTYHRCACGPDKHSLKKTLIRMINRCDDPKDKAYAWYGGKGVTVCDEWRRFPIKFIEWSIKNGWEKINTLRRKELLSIDRIDSKGHYCPENCQWISLSENSKKAEVERWDRKNTA